MGILGSVAIPVLLETDFRVQNVMVRVVEDLPYCFIFGADYFEAIHSRLESSPDRGFRHVPLAPWVPFRTAVVDTPTLPNPLGTTRIQCFASTVTPEPPPLKAPAPIASPNVRPSYHDIA